MGEKIINTKLVKKEKQIWTNQEYPKIWDAETIIFFFIVLYWNIRGD